MNNGDLKEENISLADTQINIGGLREDSTYDFYLFVTNTDGEFDEDIFMKIQKKTKSNGDSSGVITVATVSVFLAAVLAFLSVFGVLRFCRRNKQYMFHSLEHAHSNTIELLEGK